MPLPWRVRNPEHLPDPGVDDPSDSWWAFIFAGLLIPIVLLVWGMAAIVNEQAWLPGNLMGMTLTGVPAIAFGIALTGAATFAHTHWCWGNRARIPLVHDLGRIIGALMFAGGLLVVICYELVLPMA